MNIIGRERERSELLRLRDSGEPEFVMVYGRRRVGKTFLVRQTLGKDFCFAMTGLANQRREQQLQNFQRTMTHFSKRLAKTTPTDWFEAFEQLRILIEQSKLKRKVVFLDELPWMDTPKSNLVSALEHFWNDWASTRNDIMLVVCGSAASWLVKNIEDNKGGLHNRLTAKIRLMPFSLNETQKFLNRKGIRWDVAKIAECYMIMGGIPYYLNLLDRAVSFAENINRLFCNDSALLADEFSHLYASLFTHSEEYVNIVRILSKKKVGYTRQEIVEKLKRADGGGITRRLRDLCDCGFVNKYFVHGRVEALYRLVDFYTLFYLHFIENQRKRNQLVWQQMVLSSSYTSWCGLAFERLCFAHILQIKRVLGIEGVNTQTYALYKTDAQIDMIIERSDRVIDICEMKFTDQPYSLTKVEAEAIQNRIDIVKSIYKSRRTIDVILITNLKAKQNKYYTNLIYKNISLDNIIDS